MPRDGLLIGEVATKSGVSRRALRLYERAGILAPPRRTAAGYRVYGPETLAVLSFVTQARRLGFRLDEIKRIVALKRSGRTPCTHVLDLVHFEAGRHRTSARGLDRGARAAPRAVTEPAIPPKPPCRYLPLHRTPHHREGSEVKAMDNRKVTLCPAGCGACPDVVIADDEVKIGEIGNMAVLKKDEWNLLVDLIRSGHLTKI
jgi:DNA-binding transcriptional MerR regulator